MHRAIWGVAGGSVLLLALIGALGRAGQWCALAQQNRPPDILATSSSRVSAEVITLPSRPAFRWQLQVPASLAVVSWIPYWQVLDS